MTDRPLTERPCELLVVDASPRNIRLVKEVLRELERPLHLSAVHDGVAALAFLRHEQPYAQAPRPDLILLDLNLPGMAGLEVLAEVKSDPALRLIPVVMLTTSAAAPDVLNAYQRCANAYVTKPADLETFISVLQTLTAFWCGVNQPPPAPWR